MLSGLFSRKQPKRDEPSKNPSAEAKAGEVAHNPGLIAALTLQHRNLVTLLIQVRTAAQQQLYADAKLALEQFQSALHDHLNQESIELQPYLSTHLKGEGSKELLKEMRSNSAHIDRAVEGFLNHYIGYPVSERNAARFDLEIDGVTAEFSERLEIEEASLYTLYLAPEAY